MTAIPQDAQGEPRDEVPEAEAKLARRRAAAETINSPADRERRPESRERAPRSNEPVAFPPVSRANTLAAWQHLLETGEVRDDLLRPHVARAWQRALDQGCSPHLLRPTLLSPEETAALLDRERDLIEAATPYLLALSRAAREHRHAAMLADRHARVLHIIGDEHSVRGPDGVPGPGALLSEMDAGANGLGTPLAESGYVELVGPEHFIEGFHAYTCQGIPLLRSTGEPAGVLGILVRRQEATDRLREILICAARGIEADLLARDLGHAIARLQHCKATDAYAKVREDIVQLQAAARLRFETAAQRASTGHSNTSIRDLLTTSVRLVEEFHKRASLCRILVGEQQGPPRPVDLERSAGELIELLGTEAVIRGIEFVLVPGPPITLVADSRGVARALWHTFVDMLDRAGAGDIIEVRVAEAIGDAARVLCQASTRQGARGASLQLLVQGADGGATLGEG